MRVSPKVVESVEVVPASVHTGRLRGEPFALIDHTLLASDESLETLFRQHRNRRLMARFLIPAHLLIQDSGWERGSPVHAEKKERNWALVSQKAGLWCASVALALVISVGMPIATKSRTYTGEVRAVIDLHQRIIAAQTRAVHCLRAGGKLDDCETTLEENCQGTDLNQCQSFSEGEESPIPSEGSIPPAVTMDQIRI